MSACGHLATSLVLVALAAAPIRAETDAERKARAFETFGRGEAQFKQGSYDAAAQLFQTAWQTWQDPAYLFNIGLAFEKAERWPLAVEWYGRFLETYPDVPNVSEVRRRHVAAQRSREATRAEVVVTTEPAGARAEVVDDTSVAACVTPCSLRVDPGPITVRAELGERVAEAARSLGPTERWELALPLPQVVGPGVPPPEPPDRTAAVVSWSVGGLALVSGVVFGVMANGTYADGKDLAAKDGGVLVREDYDRLARLRSDLEDQSLAADLSFGAAFIGGALGVVLWLVAEPDEPAAAPTRSATWRF